MVRRKDLVDISDKKMTKQEIIKELVDVCKTGIKFLNSLPAPINGCERENRQVYREQLTNTLFSAYSQ